MQLSDRTYANLNVMALLMPLVSAVPAASQFVENTPTATTETAYGFYFLAILAALPVVLALVATKWIGNKGYYITVTLLMFTCNLMNAIFFHQASGGMLIISILLLQFFIAVPSFIYGIALRITRRKATDNSSQ